MLNQINSFNAKPEFFSQTADSKAVEKNNEFSSQKLLSGVGPATMSFKQKLKEQDKSAAQNAPRNASEKTPMANQSREPTKETKERVSPEKPEKPEEAGAQRTRGSPKAKRQKVFQEFMDSIESELGIDPARFAEAMAKVGQAQQQSKPEDVAEAVIENLELSDEKKDKAKGMYLGFLAELHQIEKPQEIKTLVVADPTSGQSQEVLRRFHSTQDQRQALSASVDQMNNKFWMNGNPASAARVTPLHTEQVVLPQGLDAQTMAPVMSAEEAMPEISQNFEAQQKLLNEVAGRQKLDMWAERANAQVQPNKTLEHAVAMKNLPTEEKMAMLAAQQNMIQVENQEQLNSGKMPRVMMNEETYSAPGAKMQMPGVDLGTSLISNQLTGANLGSMGFTSASTDEGFGQSTEDFNGQSDLGQTGTPMNADFGLNPNKPNAFFAPTAGLANTTTSGAMTSATEKNEAIQNILNQAKFLAQKGGGEMNVQMTPEGLGKVHLKVVMSDGKLQVQMSADNPEAKSLIESSISDLKHHLHSQKLAVENVKVDYVQSLNTENNSQQTQTNQHFQQRDGTKHFWNQFQENFGNRSAREGFFEFPNSKQYARQDKDPLTPMTSTQSRRFEGKGRGLNLVA